MIYIVDKQTDKIFGEFKTRESAEIALRYASLKCDQENRFCLIERTETK